MVRNGRWEIAPRMTFRTLLLEKLGDQELQAVALWKMEGYTNGDIAGRLACGVRSVGRKLRVIRGVWEQETGHGSGLGQGH